jgi:hypothetical protein
VTDGISSEDLREALGRLALNPDGEMLYLWLQKRLMGLPVVGCSDADLQKFEGGRMLAGELFALMSEGVKLSGRTDGVRPVVFRVAGPSASADSRRPSASLRRIRPGQSVPGYDLDESAPDRHPAEPATG